MSLFGIGYVRVLRTPHSERFLLRKDDRDCAALDIHYLDSQRADSTLIILDETMIPESAVPQLLKEIDDLLLPHVSIEERNLVFTVVIGRALGAFVAEEDEQGARQ